MKISRLPAYKSVLKLGRERDNAILVDMGCGFGDGLRRAIADGFPIQGALGFDLEKNFWDLGHEAFKSTPETFPVPFVQGDAFDPLILELVPPYCDAPKTPIPALNSLTSLNPLRGHVSAIYAASFFHLFSEEKQLRLARAIAGLLSPEPGSVVFGLHVGSSVKGSIERPNGRTVCRHSPDSWKEIWDGEVFDKGKIKVEAHLGSKLVDLGPSLEQARILVWSVTRL